MEKEILVYVDLNNEPCFAGHLWTRVRKDRESATFEYSREWPARSDNFALEPALKGNA